MTTTTDEIVTEILRRANTVEPYQGYTETAARLGVSEELLRTAVAEGRIVPAVHRGNVVKFHVPTVHEQIIRKGALR